MGKSLEFKEKSEKELQALNTKNLLAYYKAERQRFYRFKGSSKCHCGCGEMIWEVNHGYKKEQEQFNKWEAYICLINSMLNKREHIIKNKAL